jgi:hypothetical protein
VPIPAITLNEAACLDALRTFVLAVVPDLAAVDVYRARPAASPGKWGLSVVLVPTTPLPVFESPMGEESRAAQRQRVRVTLKTTAAGAWSLAFLGGMATYTAPVGLTTAQLRTALRDAVADEGLPVTTADAVAGAPTWAAFDIRGNTAGASLGLTLSVPAGGVATLAVVDDNIRQATYNWGRWTIRAVVRDVGSAEATGVPSRAGAYAEMLRLRLQAQSVSATAGLAYPYQRDLLRAANLSWVQTLGPFTSDVVDGGVWHRGVALDFVFDVSSALAFDVPSLDAVVVTAPVLNSDV